VIQAAHVAVVPNRSSRPAILLRESYRDGAKVKNRTLANLSDWSPERVEALRAALRGDKLVPAESMEIVRSLPHGPVAAALGMARQIGLDDLLPDGPERRRNLALALIVDRKSTNQVHRDELENPIDHKAERSDFRTLAAAADAGVIEDHEWQKSRRALVSLARQRLGMVPEMEVLPAGKFRCIVADPPWDTGTRQTASFKTPPFPSARSIRSRRTRARRS
jgi:hypothetical protein